MQHLYNPNDPYNGRDDSYDSYLICLDGHPVNCAFFRHPDQNDKFCKLCGEPTIHQCPSCNGNIRGNYHSSQVVFISSGGRLPVPSFCTNCGKEFPWTTRNMQAAMDAIDACQELDTDERNELKTQLPHLVRQTSRSEIAVKVVRPLLAKGGKWLEEVIIKYLADVTVTMMKSET